MKRIGKAITVLVLTAAFAAAGILSAAADGYVLYAGYTFSLENRLATIHSYEGDSELYIPDSIWGYTVVGIENSAFLRRTDFDSLVLQDSDHLTDIGNSAFYGCTGFTRAELPARLQNLGACAFQYCTGLQTADCDGSCLTVIDRQTFYGCTALQNVTLPDTLESIQAWAFGGCTALEYVEIPRSVTEIADTAFSNDPNLTLGVWYDSDACTYAKEKGVPYTLLDGVKRGSVSGSSEITICDVTELQRYLAELRTLEGIYLYAADANQDGAVDIADATAIQMYLAQFDNCGTIGEVMTQ